MQKHLEFTATIWSSEIAPRLTFFNLRSSKRQMTIRQLKRTTESFAKNAFLNLTVGGHIGAP